jgi:hypothetical protein
MSVSKGSAPEVARLNLEVGFPDSSRSKIQLVGLDSANCGHSRGSA